VASGTVGVENLLSSTDITSEGRGGNKESGGTGTSGSLGDLHHQNNFVVTIIE